MSVTPITTEVLTAAARFTALRSRWAKLVRECGQVPVFLQWEWLHTWWEVFATDSMELQIVLLCEGDKLVGIAPFYLQDGGLLRGKVLRFIGTGEAEQDEVLSEYLDLLVVPDYADAVINAVSEWIVANRQWRQLRFDEVLGDAYCRRLSGVLQATASISSHVSGERYSISLPESPELYFQRLSVSRRRRYQRCCAAIRKDGGEPCAASISGLHEIEQKMRVLKQLNSERWQSRSGRGVFESDRFFRFHLAVCNLLWPLGQSDIRILTIKARPVAALYLFYSGTECHYYQSGFASRDANRYMPLFVCHLSEIRRSIENNLDRYDFMRGDTGSYKKEYTCDTEPVLVVRAWRNRPERVLSDCWHHTRGFLRALLTWLGNNSRM